VSRAGPGPVVASHRRIEYGESYRRTPAFSRRCSWRSSTLGGARAARCWCRPQPRLLGRGGQCAPMPMPRDGRGVALRSTATPRFSLRARPARSRPVHLAAATGGSAPPVVTGRQRRTLPDFQRASMCRHSRSLAVTYRSDWSLIPPPRGRGDGCFGDSPCTGGNLKSIDQGVL
jgi:hypothetical protein